MSTPYAWSTIFPERGRVPEGAAPSPSDSYALRPPAAEADVRRLEERLGVGLPPSYRQFLLFADGWSDAGDEYCLRSTQTVGWFRDLESWFVEYCLPEGHAPRSVPDELYFVYGDEQDCVHIREEYLPGLLLVGHWDDGWALLNPRVTTAGGEWEAWFHAPWLPGANRYRSFWDLMEDENRRLASH
ncbi:SMI1/KNR4 family protein [[Actinomadura] parvosata]|uniref:SMI1/KNR4 family protein n=1 Tax=[Actinomadura] parvosata TaxID=1955412 RepID=UPI00406C0718